MLDLFQISVNITVSIQLLKIIDRHLTVDLPSSCPCALLMLRALVIFNISSSLKQNEESLVVET